jgi:hypothetical protein
MFTKNGPSFPIVVMFIIGIVLLGANAYGLNTSMRNPNIYTEETYFKDDITLTEDEFFSIVNDRSGSTEDYIRRVNYAVNKGMAHYWPEEDVDGYSIRVPFQENYLLNALGYLAPDHFEEYEFCTPEKAVERGIGLCSQHAIVLASILEENDIDARILGLSGHMVTTVKVNDTAKWVVDPDYGVIIDHDITWIEQDPEIVKSYYAEAGYNESIQEWAAGVYGSEGNYEARLSTFCYYEYNTEDVTYLLIWLIPVLLVIPFTFSFLKSLLYLGGDE